MSMTRTSSGCAAPTAAAFLHAVRIRAPGADHRLGSELRGTWRHGASNGTGRSGRKQPWWRGQELLRFDGIDEPLLLIPLGACEKLRGPTAGGEPGMGVDRARKGERRRAGHPRIHPLARGAASRPAWSARNRRFEQWRAKPACSFKNEKERHLWRQSETMLRIAQSREPNRAGRTATG
jgi:hypothetical protein